MSFKREKEKGTGQSSFKTLPARFMRSVSLNHTFTLCDKAIRNFAFAIVLSLYCRGFLFGIE